MSDKIDDRIVEMKFDNNQFERGVAESMSTLDKLKKALTFGKEKNDLGDLEKAGNNFRLDGMAGALDNISGKFSIAGAIGFSAIQRLTNSAIDAGRSMANALVGPILEGGRRRAIAIEQAKFQFRGLGMDVEKSMASALAAVDGTAFGLDAAASVAAQFGAAGMGAGQEMTNALRGIAGIASMTSSSFEDIGGVFTSIAGQGRLTGVHLVQLSTRGMNAAAALAKEMDTSEAKVREMVRAGKVSFKEFAEAMNNAFGEHATKANETYTGSLSNMRAALSRIGAKFYTVQLEQMRQIFNALTPVINAVNKALDPFVELFDDAFVGARKGIVSFLEGLNTQDLEMAMYPFVKGIRNLFDAFMDVVEPIKAAWRQIFPAAEGFTAPLSKMMIRFHDFTESIKMGGKTAENLKRTFAGVFAVFSIAGQIIKGLAGVFFELFGSIAEGTGGFLDFTGGIGDFLVSVDEAMKKGNGLTRFFEGLGNVIAVPIDFLKDLGGILKDIFSGRSIKDLDDLETSFGRVSDRLNPLKRLIETLGGAWKVFLGIMEKVKEFFQPLVDIIAGALASLGPAIANAMDSGNFSAVLDLLNTGLFAGILLLVKKFMSQGINLDFGGGFLGNMSSMFETLTGSLEAMQTQIKAKTLMLIASAVGILAASLVVLSLIDSDKLTKALLGVTASLGLLIGSMALLGKITVGGAFTLPAIGAALILIATSMLILSHAVQNLSELGWEELAKGLAGVMGLLLAISLAVKPLSAGSIGLISAGIGLTAVATALNIMVPAVKSFANMEWGEIGKGLVGMAGALALIAAGMWAMPAHMGLMGAGLVLVGTSLLIISQSLKMFADMDWSTMGRGLAGMAGALALIAAAMWAMPAHMALMAVGLVIVGGALLIIGKAVEQMGNLSGKEIGKGLGTIAGALLILAGALYIMQGAIPGSIALIIAAGALAILTPVIIGLAKLSWEEIAKGLLTLAGAFLIIGVAALVIAPILPAVLGLAAAIAILGVGLLAAGAGVLAFATAFTMLTAAGAAGTVVFTGMLQSIINMIPDLIKAFGEGIVAFTKVIYEAAPEFYKAATEILSGLLDALIDNAPKFGELLGVMIETGAKVIRDHAPTMAQAGWDLLQAFLEKIEQNIGKLADTAGDMIVEFISGLGRNMNKIADAGALTMLRFLIEMKVTVDRYMPQIVQAGIELGIAFGAGFVKGIYNTAKDKLGGSLKYLATAATGGLAGFLLIMSPSRATMKLGKFFVQGFAKGVRDNASEVRPALEAMHNEIKTSLRTARDEVKRERENLKRLLAADKKDQKAIKKSRKALKEAEKTAAAAARARDHYNKGLKSERQNLLKLSKQYDRVTTRLENAQTKLKDLEQAKADAVKSLTSQYTNLPDITKTTSYGAYMHEANRDATRITEYQKSLDKLRKLGLDDYSYDKLIKEGVEAQGLVDQIAARGAAGVREFNNVNQRMKRAAENLAKKAANEMHDAGIQVARGLVNGLKKEQAAIQKQMNKIANGMVKELKKKLGIKSPSQVAQEIGEFWDKGLVQGIKKFASSVTDAASNVADDAVDEMRKSMTSVQDLVTDEIDMNPVIAPVIDLSRIRQGADEIQGLMDQTPLTADLSYRRASNISAEQMAARASEASIQEVSKTIEFKQYNQSPESLSTADIYRHTKNQIAMAKQVLETV